MVIEARDFAWSRPHPADLAHLGVKVVFRYAGGSEGKDLTYAEAKSYTPYGIRCGIFFEGKASGALGGASEAEKDAPDAIQTLKDCHAPASTGVLYAVDFDAKDYAPSLPNDTDPVHNRAKLGPIAGYFDTLIKLHGGVQTVGAYGGYWVVRRLLNARLISAAMQTYAWSLAGDDAPAHTVSVKLGSHTYWFDDRAFARQIQNGVDDLPGIDMDRDQVLTEPRGFLWYPDGSAPAPGAPKPTSGSLPSHSNGSRTLRYTAGQALMVGTDVAYLQRFVGERHCGKSDGKYGPNTATGVSWYEGMRGITQEHPYGVAGPQVWHNILNG